MFIKCFEDDDDRYADDIGGRHLANSYQLCANISLFYYYLRIFFRLIIRPGMLGLRLPQSRKLLMPSDTHQASRQLSGPAISCGTNQSSAFELLTQLACDQATLHYIVRG
jgi:hypothetical protein